MRKTKALDHRTRRGAAACLVAVVMVLANSSVSADQPPVVYDLVSGSGRYFYPGSGNYHNDNGIRYTGPRTPGGVDTDIARFRDGVAKSSVTCGGGVVVPTMAILALRPRVNGTAQTRVNANGQSTAPHAPFNDGTYEWYIMQVCTDDSPHPGIVTTWFAVKTCSTVDDANPTSNDNNISTFTSNPNTQTGACQSGPLVDDIVNYSMSYNQVSMMPCLDTSFAPDPAAFETLTLTRRGVRSPNLGLATNMPQAPMIEDGTLTTCTGATIELTPWDGDEGDGLEFHRWQGACSGTGACTVTMTEATSVIALFTAEGRGNH